MPYDPSPLTRKRERKIIKNKLVIIIIKKIIVKIKKNNNTSIIISKDKCRLNAGLSNV